MQQVAARGFRQATYVNLLITPALPVAYFCTSLYWSCCRCARSSSSIVLVRLAELQQMSTAPSWCCYWSQSRQLLSNHFWLRRPTNVPLSPFHASRQLSNEFEYIYIYIYIYITGWQLGSGSWRNIAGTCWLWRQIILSVVKDNYTSQANVGKGKLRWRRRVEMECQLNASAQQLVIAVCAQTT